MNQTYFAKSIGKNLESLTKPEKNYSSLDNKLSVISPHLAQNNQKEGFLSQVYNTYRKFKLGVVLSLGISITLLAGCMKYVTPEIPPSTNHNQCEDYCGMPNGDCGCPPSSPNIPNQPGNYESPECEDYCGMPGGDCGCPLN